MIKTISMAAAIAIACIGCSGSNESQLVSQASYQEVQSNVGCGSSGEEAQKVETWNKHYADHWMVWPGEVTAIDGGEILINADYKGTDDLAVELAVADDAKQLKAGDFVEVTFLMKNRGGCTLSYEGVQAAVRPVEVTL